MKCEGTRLRDDGGKGERSGIPGIVIADGQGVHRRPAGGPRIQAFVWGGKVHPTPTLPYGRWKGAA